jgi:predicted glycosyltransferase
MNKTAKIWIDLDNSPHVPLFAPIISGLERRGHRVWVTARDRFQVAELAALHGIPNIMVGRDYGKRKVLKISGLLYRALQLFPLARREKPTVALSHGSRAQVAAAKLAGIPTIVMVDYEFVDLSFPFSIDNIFMPDAIPERAMRVNCTNIWRYPGIKEDVYVPGFRPGKDILADLAIPPGRIVVTMRPPATTAHYHNVKSEVLFDDVILLAAAAPNTVIIMLPRNDKQREEIRETWGHLLEAGKMIIPEKAVSGLDLAWHSDLVVSGGGTMVREAAALGVPAYSVFSGETGCVDRRLAETGRLKVIAFSEDMARIAIRKKERLHEAYRKNPTLNSILDRVDEVIERQSGKRYR